jgi:putative ABC transport system permease protein
LEREFGVPTLLKAMLRNYIKVAIRNLLKYKVYSFINVLGLAIGIACGLFIFMFIQNELNYDRFHANGPQIHRLIRQSFEGGKSMGTPATSGPYATALKTDFPEDVKQTVRVLLTEDLVTYENRSFIEKKFCFADSTFFQVFSFPLLVGDPATVLDEPNSIVISQEIAKKYFGEADPVGKLLLYDNWKAYQVTGILAPFPGNSHIDFELLASISTLKNQEWFNAWWNNSMFTYVLVSPQTNPEKLEAKLPGFMDKYMGDDFKKFNIRTDLKLQPLSNIYFDNDTQYDKATHGDKRVIYMFAAIALFTLAIACINFMNLSTARSIGRAKEVGLRKVLGAYQSNLVLQFLSESVVMTCISVILSLGIVALGMPFFKAIVEKEIIIPNQFVTIPLALLSIILIVGLFAGSYPAFFLSSFQPVKVLRGRFKANPQSALLRKGLVVVQFSISIVLIVGTFIIIRQMDYIRDKKLGYDKEQVLLVRVNNDAIYTNRESFKNNLLQQANISSVSAMSGEPGGFHDMFSIDIQEKKEETWNFRTVFSDYDYIKTFGIKLLAGRDFSKEYGTDARKAAIINETAVKQLGWTNQEAIGKEVFIHMRDSVARNIIGVVADFHFSSLKEKIEPMILSINDDHRVLAIKIKPGNIQETVAKIENAWLQVAPKYPFEFTFLDEVYDNLYKEEVKQSNVFSFFALVAIFIACLGLFGLAAFTAEQRTKEISVRKVLGADISSIMILLSKDFMKLVLAAFVIASPLAWYAMSRWLEDFEYRITINPVTFIIAGILASLIALLTVSYHALRTARANPVKTLRSE